MVEKKRNLALSGWSGAGTSTVTLILAHLLQRSYYYLGSVFREVVRQLTSDAHPPSLSANWPELNHKKPRKLKTAEPPTMDEILPQYESYIQPYVGRVIDQYVDHLLINASGIILETDISAFRLGKRDEYFSIFLNTDFDVRQARFTCDQRSGNDETLKLRDRELQKEYLKLWNIDIFDEQLIAKKFNIILDNSNQTIHESVTQILQKLGEISEFQSEISRIDQKELQTLTQQSGPKLKNHLRQQLQNKNLLITPQQMISEITQQFADEISQWPEDLRDIFQQSSNPS